MFVILHSLFHLIFNILPSKIKSQGRDRKWGGGAGVDGGGEKVDGYKIIFEFNKSKCLRFTVQQSSNVSHIPSFIDILSQNCRIYHESLFPIKLQPLKDFKRLEIILFVHRVHLVHLVHLLHPVHALYAWIF